MDEIHIHFRVPYMTRWGQNVVITGAGSVFGNWDFTKAKAMSCQHVGEELVWEARVSVPVLPALSYKYVVLNEQQEADAEEGHTRTLELPQNLEAGSVVTVRDIWQDASNPAYALSRDAFTKVILNNKTSRSAAVALERLKPMAGEAILRLRVWDWSVQDGQTVCITGSLPSLGNWQQSKVVKLTELDRPFWEIEVRAPLTAFPVTYKYATIDASGTLVAEHGENRTVYLPEEEDSAPPSLMCIDDGNFRHDVDWRGTGLACPVFSLRTNRSVGVGDFLDIKTLVDICSLAGFRMIQLLPINDTSVYNMWWDSYPYSSISVFALHPLYLSLEALSEDLPADIKAAIDAARKELDDKDVDYEATMSVKLRIARQLFNRQGTAVLETPEYLEYYKRNEAWLRPYAAFCFLRDLFGTAEHWQWGTLSNPTPEVLDRLTSPDQGFHDDILFSYYVQYGLHRQLLDVSRYAAARHIAFKGDLPIGVDKRSVDTWVNPRQFRMGVSTGAPPDYFDRNGQNWGFPTYNWEEMAKDGYTWWRQRLSHMSQYFHAYRIDHILGFFRIWEIPGDCVTGLLGNFRPSIPLTRTELEGHGIWDIDRLCEPWVTWPLLEQTFGELAQEVASKYFIETRPKQYKFRPEYSSEVRIMGIKPRSGSPQWLVDEVQRTQQGLMRLRQNVVLLRDPEDNNHFYPRIQLMDTSSFSELEWYWKDHLTHLHNDYFYHRQEELWRWHALKTLPVLISASNMLLCGEDLGMIPACVQPVMLKLGLVGLRIQRMPSEPNREFGEPADYDYMVVASPSCHDTSTTRAWWEEDPERRARYFVQALHMQGHPPDQCTPAIMKSIIKQHLESPAMWAIFPIQDIMGLSPSHGQRPAHEETINDPTNSKHYWRYRIHVSLEDLLADEQLIADLQSLLLGSGRCSAADLPELRAASS